MFRTIVQGLAIAALMGLGAHGALARSCGEETTLKSEPGTKPTEIEFRNGSDESRRIYWVDPDGHRKFYAVVTPRNAYTQATFVGHNWVVTNEGENCLFVVTASRAPISVEIGGASAGGKPAVAPAGAVSPIEALALEGYYRLVLRSDEKKVLNNQSSGKPEVERVKPEWSSGQWEFEEVPGTSYARIKNQWKSTFLKVDGDKLRVGPAKDDDEDAHWAFEPVEGEPYVRIKSRAGGGYLVADDEAAKLADAKVSDKDSQWQLVPVGGGEKQSAKSDDDDNDGCEGGKWKGGKCRCPEGTVFDAGTCSESDHGGVNCAATGTFYDGGSCVRKCPRGTYGRNGYCVSGKQKKTPLEYAQENCKETGGYWTGKTCKASKNSRPKKCKPGFAWSEDAGACQFDGGPPKQQAQPQQPKPSTTQQIQNIIQGIQNLQHKCGPTQFWSAQEKGCVEND